VVKGTDIITTVSWKLEENETGTFLTLEHTGIRNFPGESAVEMFNSFSGGWDNCINGLEKHLKAVNV
jgi:hypothetical protein